MRVACTQRLYIPHLSTRPWMGLLAVRLLKRENDKHLIDKVWHSKLVALLRGAFMLLVIRCSNMGLSPKTYNNNRKCLVLL